VPVDGRSTTHPHKNSRTCFRGRSSRQGKHLPFSCVITVTKLNLVRPLGLRSSEAQIPQIVVNVRNWRKTMEHLGADDSPSHAGGHRFESCRAHHINQ
jgi:hypothetical protein